MRKVVLKMTTQKDVVEHQSEARTFGELKKELRQIKWSGMRVVERASKTTFQMDDAVLPQGEFLLFLVPEKVKSGKKTSGGAETLSGPIEKCKYNELRSHMSWLNRNKGANLDMSGGTAELQKELKKHYKNKTVPTSKEAAKPAAKAPAAKKPAAKKPEPAKEEVKETKKERKAREKAEKKAAKKKAADQEAAPEKPAPTDPIEIIEDSRERINKAVDELVLNMIEGGGEVPAVLQYTEADLDKELKKVRSALRTSRSQAVYID
jgi:hypothetical protein